MITRSIRLKGVFFLMVVLSLASCQKRSDIVEPVTPVAENKQINDLKVSDSFDWSTTATYTLSVTGYANSQMKILSTDGILLHTTMLKKNVAVEVALDIPKTEQSVVIEFLGETTEVELSEAVISITL